MARAWYVLHVYSGYENKIMRTLKLMLDSNELSREVVTDIKVPSEEVIEVKDGKKKKVIKKFLPGYLLLEMDLPDDGWKRDCSAIKKVTGVTGFVGGAQHKKPVSISPAEARNMLQRMGDIKGEKPQRARQTFESGEQVKIISGPFESFSGTIEEVNLEKSKLRVMVGIFGRATPVEVDMAQVEKQ